MSITAEEETKVGSKLKSDTTFESVEEDEAKTREEGNLENYTPVDVVTDKVVYLVMDKEYLYCYHLFSSIFREK